MSLNWDLRAIADRDSVCWYTAEADDPGRGIKKGEQYLSPVTNAIIWATMMVGIGHLETEADAAEFYLRISAMEKLTGANLNSQEGPHYLTWEQIKAHVGLRTNVFPRWSRKKFGEHLMRCYTEDQRRQLKLPEPQAEEKPELTEEDGGSWVLELHIDADSQATAEEVKDDIGGYLPDIENEVDGEFTVCTGRLKRVA